MRNSSRSPNRLLIFGGIILTIAVFFIAGFLIGWYTSTYKSGDNTQNANITSDGYTSANFNYSRFILDNIDKDRIRNTLRNYSSEPRLAGTPKDLELAQQIEKEWRNNGVDQVHLATYYVRLSFPNSSDPNLVQMINTSDNTVLFESHRYEIPLTENENNSNIVPPFNSYSAAGNVTGKMVYVNYGRIEDFTFLMKNLSINVSGCIVIARYGKIFRGDKVWNAESFGASGVILYSDPADYNLEQNVSKTYPNSWWLPPSGIQRGTVGGDGDPDTPLYPSTDYAYRPPVAQAEASLPKIPVQPIGYNDAAPLLRSLSGGVVPAGWNGNLPFQYHLGPNTTNSSVTFRVIVNNHNDVRPIHNVIGYIKGSEEPDRYVMMGNHHDAWTFGAVDPLSGSAVLTELTRVFGLMLKAGHRPRRTLVFCSWDAEEEGLFGSMEWVEENLKILQQRAVAYLNLDWSAMSNYTLFLATSPLLQDLLYSVAKQVPSTEPSQFTTLYDQWLARPRVSNSATKPDLIYSLGSGSDMATFYQRAGVPSVDMYFTYDEVNMSIPYYPLYHSSYDTFYAYDNFIDPGFNANRAISQFWAILASELAWSDLIPMSVQRYSLAVSNFQASIVKQFQNSWTTKGVNIESFRSAVQNFTAATQTFQNYINDNIATIRKSPLKLRKVNDQLMYLERAFLDPEGLPNRPAQKHVVFAPSLFDAYVDNSFPGIVDTMMEIDRGIGNGTDKWEQLKKQVYVATYMVHGAARSLQDVGL